MNLFNKKYHIQIEMCKLKLEKKKKVGFKRDFYWKISGEYL